jgi:galactokinase
VVSVLRAEVLPRLASTFAAMASTGSPPPSAEPAELFVCGRLCLLGEHSDWAGAYPDPEVLPGKCLVVGTSTNQGLHARVSLDPARANTFTMVSTDDTGVSRTRSFALDDPESLREEARAGGFWSHVAGTVWTLLRSEEHRDSVSGAPISARVAEGLGRLPTGAGIRLDNYKTTLPIKKGLSSSAAVCVLVARAFSNALELRLTPLQEARLAYSGERETPSRCGRMDQAGCAFGPGRLVTLVFSGDGVQVEPLRRVGRTLHLVVADLNASKDTVSILRDLQEAFFSSPTTETTKTKRTTNVSGDTQNTSTTEMDDREGLADRKEQERRKTGVARDLRLLLGKTNHDFVARAVDAVERGDAKTLGAVYDDAQNAFDKIAGAASPGNLGVVGSPVLHATRTNKSFEPFVFGSKGVGSQGDGSVQFLCRGATDARRCVEILRDECGAKDAFVLEVPRSADAKATEVSEEGNAAAA